MSNKFVLMNQAVEQIRTKVQDALNERRTFTRVKSDADQYTPCCKMEGLKGDLRFPNVSTVTGTYWAVEIGNGPRDWLLKWLQQQFYMFDTLLPMNHTEHYIFLLAHMHMYKTAFSEENQPPLNWNI